MESRVGGRCHTRVALQVPRYLFARTGPALLLDKI